MTTTPQAALLREAAQNALITLDGIASANPRDTADFETPAEWIAWAKSRARFAADALREPQTEKKCGTCGFIGQEDPVKGCPKCGFDDMRDKLQATQGALLSDEEIMRNWSGGACPDWAIKFVRACFAAQHAKLQAPRADPVQAGELPEPDAVFYCSEDTGYLTQYLRPPANLTDGDVAMYEADTVRSLLISAALAARKPFTPAQRMRLWQNTEKGKSATSLAAFERIVQTTEAAHRIGINSLEVKP